MSAVAEKQRKSQKGKPKAPRVDFEHRPQDQLARKLVKAGTTHEVAAKRAGLKVSRVGTITKHMRRKGELPTLRDRQGKTDWVKRIIARYDDLIEQCQRLRQDVKETLHGHNK
jgi:hypothetical protein